MVATVIIFIISDGLEGGSPEFSTAGCQALPPLHFTLPVPLSFPLT